MVRVCGLIAGVILLAPARQAGAQDPLPEVKIGFPKPMFKDVSPGLIRAAAGPFQGMIQKLAGLNGSMEVVPDYKALADRLKAGKIDIAVFHGFEYAWVKDTPGLEPVVVTVPNCGKVQACLVVNAASPAKSPKDLKGACVAVPRGSKAHCEMFHEWLLKEEKVPSGDCCPAKLTGMSPEEVLEAVLDGKCEAALVDCSALHAYQLNNPGAFASLKVLRESVPLPSAVVVVRKGALTVQQVIAIRDGLLNCNRTAQGKTFLLFWNLKGFAEVSDKYMAAVDRALKAYPTPVAPPAAPPAAP